MIDKCTILSRANRPAGCRSPAERGSSASDAGVQYCPVFTGDMGRRAQDPIADQTPSAGLVIRSRALRTTLSGQCKVNPPGLGGTKVPQGHDCWRETVICSHHLQFRSRFQRTFQPEFDRLNRSTRTEPFATMRSDDSTLDDSLTLREAFIKEWRQIQRPKTAIDNVLSHAPANGWSLLRTMAR